MAPETLVLLLAAVGLGAALATVMFVLVRRPAGPGRRSGRVQPNGSRRRRSDALDADELWRLSDLAGVGLVRVDGRGTIVAANPAAHRFLGRRADTLAGLSVIAAFLDHRIEALLRSADEEGHAELELASGGEPPHTLLVRAERTRDDAGDRWLLLADVSELRRLQRIRAEFVDNLAHELRTPLTTIRVLAEVLSGEAEHGRLSPRVRDAIGKIDVETGHLAQMVGELLDLARIEQGATPLRRDNVDLGRLAKSAIERLRAYAGRQGVSLRAELDVPADERTIPGDDERLEQVLVNLLHNAVKFSPSGSDVVVALLPAEAEVVLEVADQGVGIPRGELERIFERFYKADPARARRASTGTGLGLAIARHIVEGHGGRIWAESEEGRGARFFVALPRRH